MSKITTLGIGGPAKEYVIVKTSDELVEAVNYSREKDLEFLMVGGGSNLLVADEGLDKLVIKNETSGILLDPPRRGDDSRIVHVKSGTILQDLVNFTVANGLSGMQKLTGIPGTVGGAVYGGVGAYGQQIFDFITDVSVLKDGQVINLTKASCQFDYRDSIFKRNRASILEVSFELKLGDLEVLKLESEKILSDRLKKYPSGIKCPGSFFKNILAENLSGDVLSKIPEEKIPYGKVSVGYLLEAVGAKGDHLGDIEITPYHANLFINKGDGTASDFYFLAKKYSQKVKQKFGIEIEPEVQLINLPPLL